MISTNTGEFKFARLLDESKWLSLLKDGDERIFEEVYHDNRRILFSLALIYLKYNVHDAEDVVAEAFTRFWNHRETIECIAHVRPWLCMATRNCCINILRKMQRRRKMEHIIQTDEDISTFEFEVAHAEMMSFIHSEIEKLPEHQRKAFTCLYELQMSGKETASEMQVSNATVTRYKQAAIGTLRKILRTKTPG